MQAARSDFNKISCKTANQNHCRLAERVEMSGLKFRDTTPADGNCLFHAVSDQLKRVKSEKPYCHSELRALAISCLKDHQFVVRTASTLLHV